MMLPRHCRSTNDAQYDAHDVTWRLQGAPAGYVVLQAVRDYAPAGHKTNLLVQGQVGEALQTAGLAKRATFNAKVRAVPAAKCVVVPCGSTVARLFDKLRAANACGTQSNMVQLLSVRTAREALKKMGLSIQAEDLGPLAHASRTNAMPYTGAQQDQPLMWPFFPMHLPFPDTEGPAHNLTPQQRTEKFGLLFQHGAGKDPSRLPYGITFKNEGAALLAWLRNKIQVSRPFPALGASASQDVIQAVSQFLGYCVLYKKTEARHLSVMLLTNQQYDMDFVSFLRERSGSGQHKVNVIVRMDHCLDWLLATSVEDPSEQVSKQASTQTHAEVDGLRAHQRMRVGMCVVYGHKRVCMCACVFRHVHVCRHVHLCACLMQIAPLQMHPRRLSMC